MLDDLVVIDTVAASSLEANDYIEWAGDRYEVLSTEDESTWVQVEARNLDTEDDETLIMEPWDQISLLGYDHSED